MRLYLTLFAIWLIAGSLSSCKDYLNIDDYFDDELKLDSVFAQKRYIEAYMWNAATQFYDEGKVFRSPYTPGPYATDEAFTLASTGEYTGMGFALGEVTSSDLKTFGVWDRMYKIIRQCNIIFMRIDEAPDWTTAERYLILSYTRFLRAYAYYHIIVDFGPPILVGDIVMNNNEDLAYYDTERALYDEAIEYICSEMEEAAKGLPQSQQIINFGRPTKAAAYGLIARLRLIHASPLYNGGFAARQYFGTWQRSSDKQYYVSQTYDETRWAIAAAAAKRVMEMSDGTKPLFDLYTVGKDTDTPELPTNVTSDPNFYADYPNGANGIDIFRSVSELHNGEAVAAINPEYVWGRNSAEIAEMGRRSFPITANGWSECCIPQKIIDNFRMVDGCSIYNSSDQYPYSENGFSDQPKSFSGYQLNSGISNMYANREMRFYANVGFSECFWPMASSTTAGQFNQTITYYYDSSNGKQAAHNNNIYTATGYVAKKTIHRIDAWTGDNNRRMPKAFGIIRYAEILLSYAEALNNLTSSHTIQLDDQTLTVSRDIEEMRAAFNRVRYRAGLPGLTDSELSNKNTMQSLIEQERMIEFMHENRRFYDVRRWGIFEETESVTVSGMNVDATRSGFYQRVIVNSVRVTSRKYDKKMIFLPLHKNEVRRVPSLDQNPGWDD